MTTRARSWLGEAGGMWSQLILLLTLLSLGCASVARPGPADLQREPPTELVIAWLVAGHPGEATSTALDMLQATPDSWPLHVAYVRAALDGPARSWVAWEYRQLAELNSSPGFDVLARFASLMATSARRDHEDVTEFLEAARAWAGPGDLLAATVLVEIGRWEEALSVLEHRQDPDAVRLRVEALVALGRGRAAGREVSSSLSRYPDRPDVAVYLWARGAPRWGVRGPRRAAVRAALSLLDSAASPAATFRAWELLAWSRSREGADLASRQLEEQIPGLALPARLPYGGPMLRRLAELAAQGVAIQEEELTPEERARVAARKAALLARAGEEGATDAWLDAAAQAPDRPHVLLDAAESILDQRPEEALELARRAREHLAAEPEGQWLSQHLARSHAVEASALQRLGSHLAAGSYLTARALGPRPDVLAGLATLQEELGHTDAAAWFWAEAAALKHPGAMDEVRRLYRGPAGPEAMVAAAAERLAGEPRPLATPASAPNTHQELLEGRVLETDQGPLSLADLRGQVVVLAFWASWCAPCFDELPLLAGLQESWTRDGVQARIVAISLDEREGGFRRGARRLAGLGLPIAWAPELGAELEIRAVPANWILDPGGAVVERHRGFDQGMLPRLDRQVRRMLE